LLTSTSHRIYAEFYAAEPTPTGPIYTDFAIGTHPLYACECTIDKQAPADAPFGGRTLPFPNKKAAKANAAREAVLWLKGNGYMSAEGNKKRKGKVGGMAIVAEVVGAGSGKEVSWAARVNGLSFLRLSIINKTDGPLNFTHAKKNRSVPPSLPLRPRVPPHALGPGADHVQRRRVVHARSADQKSRR